MAIVLFGFNIPIYPQYDDNKETVAIIQIDSKGFTLNPAQMGDITRVELDKLGQFQVIDKYDVTYLIEKNNLNIK